MERNKMNTDDIDYTEKIRNFQAMVDNYNEEIALSYLTKADWDETVINIKYNLESKSIVSK